MCETEVEDENDKLVLLLEKVPGCEDVNEEDIREWMANDEVDEITDKDSVEILTLGDKIEEEEEEAFLYDRKISSHIRKDSRPLRQRRST